MDDFLDRVWEFIEIFLNNTVIFLDTTLSPLEALGPGFVIFVLALFVVLTTRVVAKFYVTKRYVDLEKQFQHWKGIREEALKHPDKEKGKTLAKNVDPFWATTRICMRDRFSIFTAWIWLSRK